jgi:hypothetical protein
MSSHDFSLPSRAPSALSLFELTQWGVEAEQRHVDSITETDSSVVSARDPGFTAMRQVKYRTGRVVPVLAISLSLSLSRCSLIIAACCLLVFVWSAATLS